ncbi:MAG: SMP-30/gluconolactonase/LRE family protein [Pseudomonadota bacterium]
MRLSTSLIAALVSATPALADMTVIDKDAHFAEGPAVVDGTLYYVEYAGQTMMRWDGELTEFWRRDGCGPAATILFQGGFLVTCYDSGEVVQVSATGETLSVVTQDTDGGAFVGPNDFTDDGEGGVWMTASGPWDSAPIEGVVYHIAADLTVRRMASDMHYANGIARSGSTLYIAESEAARIIAFDIGEGGALSNRRLFVRIGQVDETSGPWAYPDGIKIGPEGNLWIGSYAAGRIVVVSPTAEFVRAVDVPAATAPNLAFGDGGEIYVMTVNQTDAAPYAGLVYRMEP